METTKARERLLKYPPSRPVQLPIDLHRKIARIALERDEFIQDIVVQILERGIPELAGPAKN